MNKLTFQNIINPISKEDFIENYFDKKAFYSTNNLNSIFSWSDLNHGLSTSLFQEKNIIFKKPGIHEVIYHEHISNSLLLNLCMDGYTLYINDMSFISPNLAEIANNLAEEINTNCHISLTAGFPGIHADNMYKSTYDSYILQLEGDSLWQVFYPLATKFEKSGDKPTEPYLECNLQKGDILYVPFGHWKRSIPQKPSLFISINFEVKNGMIFYQWIKNSLNFKTLKSQLPIFDLNEKEDQINSIFSTQHNLARILEKIMEDPELYKKFFQNKFLRSKKEKISLP